MAARLNPRNAESTRQKIQITQLIKRLQNHAFGEAEMTATQVDSAKFLINKRMPNPPESKDVNLNMVGRIEVAFE
jgi:hypothetical protein